MQYLPELNVIRLTTEELDALGKEFAPVRNRLSQYPPASSSTAELSQAVLDFQSLPEPVKADFLQSLKILGAPGQTALYYEVVAKQFTSSLLAWPEKGTGSLAQIIDTGEAFYLGCPTPGDLSYLLQRNLVVDRSLISSNLNLSFSADSALVILALVDVCRFNEIDSLITHRLPDEIISLDDVMERIGDSTADDYRWILNLMQKSLPFNIAQEINSPRVADAMKELKNIGLLELVDEGEETPFGALPPLYRFSSSGKIVQSSLLESESIELFGISREKDGAVDYEVSLLARSVDALFMILWSPAESSLYSLSPASFEIFLEENQLGSLFFVKSAAKDEEKVGGEAVEEGAEHAGN